MFENVPSEIVVFFASVVSMLLGLFASWVVTRGQSEIPALFDRLKESVAPDTLSAMVSAANLAVRAAQQARLNELIENTGAAAKQEAIRTAQQFLNAQGLEEIDVQALSGIIEGVYHELKPVLKAELKELGIE